jgi:hypothetical protein
MATITPGTYRADDLTPVELADAQAVWIPLAREALMRVAGEYQGFTTYAELAEEIQERSNIRTRQLVRTWLGAVLGAVSRDCHERSEPLLSSLCVQKDGSIGAGYASDVAAIYGGSAPDDIELAAAEERHACYRYFGATLPADGGQPTFLLMVAKRRASAKRREREDRVRPTCASCGIQTPASGICDYCS